VPVNMLVKFGVRSFSHFSNVDPGLSDQSIAHRHTDRQTYSYLGDGLP